MSLGGLVNALKFVDGACARNPSILKELINIRGFSGQGILHFAAERGLTDKCKILVEDLKFDINLKDKLGYTPLICAASKGHTATAKYLLEQGARGAIKNESARSALYHAAANGDIELMKFLIDKNPNVDIRDGSANAPLSIACTYRKPASVQFLLKHGVDPNGQPRGVSTPLQEAALLGSIECVELLIKAHADVNSVARGSYPSPLHIAAYKGIPEIINCLLRAKANPNATSNKTFPRDEEYDGSKPRKPLDIAITFGHDEAIKILSPVTKSIDHPPITLSECMSKLYDIPMENWDKALFLFAVKFLEKYPDLRIDFMNWEDKVAMLQSIMSSNLYPI